MMILSLLLALASAQTPTPDLERFVGTYQHFELLSLPEINRELRRLVPPQQGQRLYTRLRARPPITRRDEFLILLGAENEADVALVAISMTDGRIFVALAANQTVTIFGRGPRDGVPEFVEAWAQDAQEKGGADFIQYQRAR